MTARPTMGPGSTPTRVVLGVMAAVLVLVSVRSTLAMIEATPIAIDLLIPLQAAERWLAGGVPYLPDGFTDPEVLPPFLYPPFVLPVFAVLSMFPEDPLRWAWVIATAAAGLGAYRWLGFGWLTAGLGLLWVPMSEGIWTGNLGVPIFLVFAVTLWHRAAAGSHAPVPRDLEAAGPGVGFGAASVAALKVSQVHVWLAVLRRRPRSAVIGTLPWVAVVLATLPLVGLPIYIDWLEQGQLATDPSWSMMGASLLAYLPSAAYYAIVVATILAALVLRGRDLGAWLGILMFVATPNMHSYTGLLLVPAMLVIRRELALMAAILMATYTAQGWWLGAAIVIAGLALASRIPVLRQEPGPAR